MIDEQDIVERLKDLALFEPDGSLVHRPSRLHIALIEAAKEIERLRAPERHESGKKMRIYVNRSLDKIWSPNKRAAHAVHAALIALGVHTGQRVVVLEKGPTVIAKMRTVVHDAGHTELAPGTLTAGTDWPRDSEE